MGYHDAAPGAPPCIGRDGTSPSLPGFRQHGDRSVHLRRAVPRSGDRGDDQPHAADAEPDGGGRARRPAGARCLRHRRAPSARPVVSSPAVVLAAAAARTERIRLTSAVTVLSSDDPGPGVPGLRHASICSRAAVRRSWPGAGRPLSPFLCSASASRTTTSSSPRSSICCSRSATPSAITLAGKHRPPIDGSVGVYPRPMQDPLPIWVAVGRPESAVRAGTLGLPMALAIIGGPPSGSCRSPSSSATRRMRRDMTRCRRLSINSHGYVAETSQQAVDESFPHVAQMMNTIGRERGWPPLTREQYDGEATLRGANFVGSPQQVIEKILFQHEIFEHDRVPRAVQRRDDAARPVDALDRVVRHRGRAGRADRARAKGLDAGELARTGFRSRPGREAPARHHVSMPPWRSTPCGARRPPSCCVSGRCSPRWRSARSWSRRRRRLPAVPLGVGERPRSPRRSRTPRSRRTAWGSPIGAPTCGLANGPRTARGRPVGTAGRGVHLRRADGNKLLGPVEFDDLRWRHCRSPTSSVVRRRPSGVRRRAALRGHRRDPAHVEGDRGGERVPASWLPDIVATTAGRRNRATRWCLHSGAQPEQRVLVDGIYVQPLHPAAAGLLAALERRISTRARGVLSASPRRQSVGRRSTSSCWTSRPRSALRRATFAWQAPALTEPPITLEDAYRSTSVLRPHASSSARAPAATWYWRCSAAVADVPRDMARARSRSRRNAGLVVQ